MRILIILSLLVLCIAFLILAFRFYEDAMSWQKMYASEAKSHETTMKIWQRDINKYKTNVSEVKKQAKQVETKISSIVETSKKQNVVLTELGIFEATAYDLSVQSCGKYPDDEGYGITANGTSLIGHSRKSAMVVAVDTDVIPLGTKLLLRFSDGNESYTGVYTAVDTGSAIKGNIIDIFMGDFDSIEANQKTINFGRQNVEVYVLN